MAEPPHAGQVWRYSYLWAWQFERGEDAGRKTRPCTVVISLAAKDGETAVYFLAITSQNPSADRFAIEVPDTEKKRAGLDATRRLWVILDEYNTDIVERSGYFSERDFMGTFSLRFFKELQRAFLRVLKAKATSQVERFDR